MCKWQTCVRNESNSGWNPSGAQSAGQYPSGERSECEHTCWDPKDGELCLSRAKPGETLVEARSDSDVQIDHQIWVKRMIRGSGGVMPSAYSQTLNGKNPRLLN
ncbi:LOW QUALITY PROTEIN: hypothetical protein HJC23_005163 [Cyclotella cryptica]|uniref:Uncharacterized protein n=1 Tax=Cyclotella cryptica TaxID=29204 RepID=A0ABD3QG09_9STRA